MRTSHTGSLSDDIVAAPETPRGLYERFLGAPFDVAQVKAVLAVEHSYSPSQQVQAESSERSAVCGGPGLAGCWRAHGGARGAGVWGAGW